MHKSVLLEEAIQYLKDVYKRQRKHKKNLPKILEKVKLVFKSMKQMQLIMGRMSKEALSSAAVMIRPAKPAARRSFRTVSAASRFMMAMQTISRAAPATCFKGQTGIPSIAVPHHVSSLSPNAATRRPSRCISRYMAIPACPVPNITHPFIRLLLSLIHI